MTKIDYLHLKDQTIRRICGIQLLALVATISSVWMTELFDPPFNWSQVSIISAFVVISSSLMFLAEAALISKIKYLEGFFTMCASCKQVRLEGEWVSVESFLKDSSEVQLSHGICPTCVKKLYGDHFSSQSSDASRSE